MTQDAYLIFWNLVQQVWRFFSEWYIPGTNVTPAGFMFVVAFTAIILRFLKRVTWTSIHEKGSKDDED